MLQVTKLPETVSLVLQLRDYFNTEVFLPVQTWTTLQTSSYMPVRSPLLVLP